MLKATRASCAWSALGHAVAGYDAALSYARQRTQFGRPPARLQIVQEKLVRMLCEITAMQLYCLRIGRLDDTDDRSDMIAALAKLNNTTRAREVLAEARNLLGGNGDPTRQPRRPSHGRHRSHLRLRGNGNHPNAAGRPGHHGPKRLCLSRRGDETRK